MATQASDSIRQRPRATTADDLAVIVQRAQSFTNASGAAIAISEGNTDEIVCRARSGSSAPDVGAALRVEGSFTGICIQTDKELRCDDAETDTRVDTGAIRALGIRSMVVTPIRDEGKVVGVLAAFAPTPHAFTITHVAVLKTMADQITVLLQKERRLKDEPQVDDPAPAMPMPVAMPKPAIPAVPLPPPVVIKPASGPSTSAAAAAAPARSNGSSVPRIEPRNEPRPVALAADISSPVPFPRKEEKRELRWEPRPELTSPKPEPVAIPKANFGTLDAVAGEPNKSSSGKLVVIGVVLALLVVAVAGWLYLSKHKAASQTQAPQQQDSASATSAPAPPVTPNPAAAVAANSTAPAGSTPSLSKADVPEKVDNKKPEARKKEQPAAPPQPTTVELSNGPSRITRIVPQAQTPDVSPSLALGSGTSSDLASLARPVNTSKPAMLSHSDLVNAKPIRSVQPIYTQLARATRISGTAIVKVIVGKDGKVSNPRFISGPIIFRDAALDAAKQWLFEPAKLNGQPIEQETEIRLILHP